MALKNLDDECRRFDKISQRVPVVAKAKAWATKDNRAVQTAHRKAHPQDRSKICIKWVDVSMETCWECGNPVIFRRSNGRLVKIHPNGGCGAKNWRAAFSASIEKSTSFSTLHKEGLTSSRAACFVNPNARCPVCQALVFFYQNEFGSRVFFNELGPEWEKHQCTDRGRQPAYMLLQMSPPSARSRGRILELLEAADLVGLEVSQPLIDRDSDSPWRLVEVLSVTWRQNVTILVGRILDQHDRLQVEVTIENDGSLVSAGSVIAITWNEISLLNPKTLEAECFQLTGPPRVMKAD